MGIADVLVIATGVTAIAWVNWYFFMSGRSTTAARAGQGGAQEVRIAVLGGYDPARVVVAAGAPVRLIFDRREKAGCSEEVVIPDFGIRRFLPPYKETVVELTPTRSGTHEFTCGMGMLRGRIVVEESKG